MDHTDIESSVDAPRGDVTREWELFVRESAGEPLRHAGSVSAPSAAVAREQAARLFDWAAETLWLCPADETRRFAAEGVALADRAGTDGGEETTDGDAGAGEETTDGDAGAGEETTDGDAGAEEPATDGGARGGGRA